MEESVLVTSKTMAVSDRIFLKDDNERLCNICQATEIYILVQMVVYTIKLNK
jgi:hypothetical protein